ncbi:TetR/AcrR family transcriptional regulator C-terminal domain-containing protein [Streptomyces netropsis]|uniref:AcrR family transcriptional regulator n=1 Tax=Streptomyces netropsis TaxID=55404 RepID=A0A7W7PIB1_STRNE|nr:TetR/AcrR family transcriptional regulator C-terminal domain-containing protein [Streptomyces netropsis]MBB4889610.1 AcrR family transcriptional regulator [Streptomyces netropsis]
MTDRKKGEEGEEEAPVSLWERLERPSPTPRAAALTPHRIATVAVGIADAEGLDAVTMRRLATALGVAPMAAYRYVSGKDDVLALMVDLVYGELAVPTAIDWRESMRVLALNTRTLLLEHPWLARLPAPQAVLALTPNRIAVAERALTVLDGLGLDADTMMSVLQAVTAYTYGSTHSEIAMRQLMEGQGWSSGDEVRTALAPQMAWLMKTGRYPAFQSYALQAHRKDDARWRFETGLDYVLDGIAARMRG